jgi:hypothetical protein
VKDVARHVLATTAALPATGDFDAPAFNIATASDQRHRPARRFVK